jgi:hypothetical protein
MEPPFFHSVFQQGLAKEARYLRGIYLLPLFSRSTRTATLFYIEKTVQLSNSIYKI